MPTDFSGGRYRVKRLLGQGSKKTVYLAHDTLLDRDVAFALIKTEADEVSGSRILREAQAMGRLSAHTNIVTVFDLGEHDGKPFMVTELMAGGDLGTLIDKAPNRRIPLSQAIEIAKSVCLGLEFAHSNGIVHRDLKPGNVWLAADGTAKSDLYSLGAMLYEMVTGTPPFLGGDAVTIIGQHVNNVPVPPTWHNPSCPQPLEDLIVGLLEKSPAARPESTADVLSVLEAIHNSMSLAEAAPFDPRNSIEQVALTVALERPDLSGRAAPDGTVTVLFSDIEASTTMTERLGDQKAQEVLRAHNAIIRSQVATHEGFEVKSLGDGFMLVFSSARRAVQCAIAIQVSFASYNEGQREHSIRVRIGLHAGEVVREVDDFYGKNVILASRIAGQATGGQILVSALLKELTESSGDLRFGDGHDVKLKGLTGTTRVFPVIWDQTSPSGGGVGSASRSQVLKRLVLPTGRSRFGKAAIALAAVTGVVAAGLWFFGAFSGSEAQPDAGLLALAPGSVTRWVSPDGDVTVTTPAGAVETPVTLVYRAFSSGQIPELPAGYLASNRVFDLSVGGPEADAGGTFSFLKPITLSVVISAEDSALAGGVQSNVVIQHFKSGAGWSPLPTEVDFQASTAQTETASLSVFALTIRKPPQTPAPVPTATATPTLAAAATPIPTEAAAPTPTPSPTLGPTLTAVPAPTPARAPQPAVGQAPSVWFGEIFSDRATLSLEKATLLSPENPERRFYGRFQSDLELMGFEVTRGLTMPTREELSTFNIIVIPVPNNSSLTQQFVDTVLALVAEESKGLLVIADQGRGQQGPLNQLTQQLGVRVHSGEVTSLVNLETPEVFNIRDFDESHPVTQGIIRITASRMAPMVVTDQRENALVQVIARAPEGAEAPDAPSAGPFAHTVAIEYGGGRILIIADNLPFTGRMGPDEKQLIANAIKWLSEPTGSPSPRTFTPVPTPTPTTVTEYLLETGITPEGEGTVEVLPASDNQRYPSGAVVLVFARCSRGFVSWSGDVPGIVSLFSNPITIDMDRPRSLVAQCAGAAPTPVPTATRAPTATPRPTPTPAPTRTPMPTPTPAPTLAPTLGGLGSGDVITVRYSYSLSPKDSPSGNSWELSEALYQPSWSFDASGPVRYLVTTAKPLDPRGGSRPLSSAIGPSGSYTYEWLPDQYFNLNTEELVMVDPGVRLQRDATPSTLQPGVNQVSIVVVAELLRLPTVDGSHMQPTDVNFRAMIGDRGVDFDLGAEIPLPGGGSPIKVVSFRGSSELNFDPPVEVGRVYTLEFEVGLLNPNSFPVIFSPAVHFNIDIDALPLGLETPVGSATNTATVSFDVRGAAGETLHITLENPSGENVGWQVESQYGPIFDGLGQYWNGVLARAN